MTPTEKITAIAGTIILAGWFLYVVIPDEIWKSLKANFGKNEQ